jgi:hypothetical protein
MGGIITSAMTKTAFLVLLCLCFVVNPSVAQLRSSQEIRQQDDLNDYIGRNEVAWNEFIVDLQADGDSLESTNKDLWNKEGNGWTDAIVSRFLTFSRKKNTRNNVGGVNGVDNLKKAFSATKKKRGGGRKRNRIKTAGVRKQGGRKGGGKRAFRKKIGKRFKRGNMAGGWRKRGNRTKISTSPDKVAGYLPPNPFTSPEGERQEPQNPLKLPGAQDTDRIEPQNPLKGSVPQLSPGGSSTQVSKTLAPEPTPFPVAKPTPPPITVGGNSAPTPAATTKPPTNPAPTTPPITVGGNSAPTPALPTKAPTNPAMTPSPINPPPTNKPTPAPVTPPVSSPTVCLMSHHLVP